MGGVPKLYKKTVVTYLQVVATTATLVIRSCGLTNEDEDSKKCPQTAIRDRQILQVKLAIKELPKKYVELQAHRIHVCWDLLKIPNCHVCVHNTRKVFMWDGWAL